ncbi:MAG: hypothetical protein CVU55_09920 [Deltaproteobacteria bacterium HGW-Deltaproteobacteria-13]|jgi:hypothetical protein|nr:MAG: hypothetical protein CVU55_09920 [Deltaproteobacteria bacterium HGW-Deltaproteobacteria-13]
MELFYSFTPPHDHVMPGQQQAGKPDIDGERIHPARITRSFDSIHNNPAGEENFCSDVCFAM